MKKIICVLCFALTVVISCENRNVGEDRGTGNNMGNPINPDGSTGPAQPPTSAFDTLSFNREIFDHERQLWVVQDIQNYSYTHTCVWSGMPNSVILIIQNGEISYYRYMYNWPDWRVFGPVNRNEILYAVGMKIPITSLYAQIDKLVNEGGEIAIKYNSDFHYPSEVWYREGNMTHYFYATDFTLDFEVPFL